MVDGPWLPGGSIYLDRSDTPHVRAARPLNQGDVYVNVRTVRAGPDEKTKVEVGPVILIGHPCAIYRGRTPFEMQFVAAVRPVVEAVPDRPFEAPWDTHKYLFPLPNLMGGTDYVADFRRLGMTHFKNLRERRVACLNREGWAALQRRWAWHTLRANIPLDERAGDIRGLWTEFALWEEWTSRGHEATAFETWFREPQAEGPYQGTARSDLIDFGMDELWLELPPPPSGSAPGVGR